MNFQHAVQLTLLSILFVTSSILVTMLILRSRAFSKKRRLENIVADYRNGGRARR